MFRKAFVIADRTVELISDTPVADSEIFRNFRDKTAGGERMVVKIVHSPLPEKKGDPVFSDGTGAYYELGGCGYYYSFYPTGSGIKPLACRVTQGDEITLLVVPGQELWDSLVAFAVNFTQLLFFRGVAVAHASCIEYHGKAILFAGDKGAGKSTQAELWRRFRGARIINGDRIALKASENGVTALGIPFCGSSKIALNASTEAAAVVFPGKAERNVIYRTDAFTAFKAVLGVLTYHTEDAAQMKTAVAAAQCIAETLPVFTLRCLPDESAVKILEEELCRI